MSSYIAAGERVDIHLACDIQRAGWRHLCPSKCQNAALCKPALALIAGPIPLSHWYDCVMYEVGTRCQQEKPATHLNDPHYPSFEHHDNCRRAAS
jgi:hypothetical protein